MSTASSGSVSGAWSPAAVPAAAETETEALIRRVYAEHGHPDDWGVQVIYVDSMVKYLAPLLSARDEAVRAAARLEWRAESDPIVRGIVAQAQREAWDEGYDMGDPYQRRGNPGEGKQANPYRRTVGPSRSDTEGPCGAYAEYGTPCSLPTGHDGNHVSDTEGGEQA